MSYTDDIIRRADIQHFREFVFHGVEERCVSEKSYKERIDEAEKAAFELFRNKFPSTDEFEKITGRLFEYVSAVQAVYFEIGLKCGAKLTRQLLTE